MTVNRHGLSSEPALITVSTKPVKKKVLLMLTVDDAKLDKRMKIETKGENTTPFSLIRAKGTRTTPCGYHLGVRTSRSRTVYDMVRVCVRGCLSDLPQSPRST